MVAHCSPAQVAQTSRDLRAGGGLDGSDVENFSSKRTRAATRIAQFVAETHEYLGSRLGCPVADLRGGIQVVRKSVLMMPSKADRNQSLALCKFLDRLYCVDCETRHFSDGKLVAARPHREAW